MCECECERECERERQFRGRVIRPGNYRPIGEDVHDELALAVLRWHALARHL